MIKKWIYVLIILLLVVAGCSKSASTNKANLDEEVFEKGTKLVQYTYMEVNDEDVPEEELKELLKWYSNKVELEEYASEEEELFFSKLYLIKLNQKISSIQSLNDKLSGKSGNNDSKREDIEILFQEIEDIFGIIYK